MTAALQDYELYLTRFPNLRIMPLNVVLARETALTTRIIRFTPTCVGKSMMIRLLTNTLAAP